MSIARHFASLLVKQSAAGLFSGVSAAGGHRLPRMASVLAHQRLGDQGASLHTTGIRCESALAKLRKKTGYAFSLCRKALEMHDQDMAKAEKWLRAEAAKQGWEKAQRVGSRATGEGLIGIYTTADKTSAAMVEVKCETDFVAKNQIFIELVTKLAEQLSNQSASIHQASDSRDMGDSINKLWIVDEAKLAEIGGATITQAISKLGENIRFVRGCIIRIQGNQPASDLVLLPYTHAVAGKISSNDPNVILGKYGTIIAVRKRTAEPKAEETVETPEQEEFGVTSSSSMEEIGTKLGQHIIGLSPLTVSPPPVDASASADASASGEDVPAAAQGDEEPTALLKQRFIFNDEITVEQFLSNSNAQVMDFVRFECGEEVESS